MFYDQKDERPYIFFVKLPQIEQKFAMGCKTLKSASIVDVMELASHVAKKTTYVYTDEPVIYCSEFDKIIADDTALSFCVSMGYSFEVLDGMKDVLKLSKQNSKVNASTDCKIEYNEFTN